MLQKRQLLQQKLLENWISTCRRLKLNPCLSPCTKVNSKWIKDLNIKPETLKQVQEAVGNKLEQIGTWQHPKQNSKGLALREIVNKWDCIKLKSFCTTKETVTRPKRQPTEWEKISASYLSDRRLISRIYRELKKLNPKRINTPMKKWAHELNREISKEEVQMPSKYM
jgi:hypothetical protein